ncbi:MULTISPECIES: IPTL-CTERM sorting domain-containing protein [unclassified Acidovorax]|uniref:IPTL-CTERM sorting domain-containing protein n=1 Tax=unclassified Acidovorax TaxID=2684926 RepID=UPI0009E7634A
MHLLNSPQRAHRKTWGVVAALTGLLAASGLHAWAASPPATASPTQPTPSQVRHHADHSIAVPFEANQGQFAPEVAFGARTFAGALYITKDGTIVHALAGRAIEPMPRSAASHGAAAPAQRGPGWALVEKLDGTPALAPSGLNPSPVRVNRFQGSNPAHWPTDIATFSSIALGDAWPGISVSLAARGSNVEKLFTVAPGADPGSISLSIEGTTAGLRLAPDGALMAATGHGEVAFTAPIAFQLDTTGRRVEVPVHYALLADRTGYRFQVGDYDRSRALVIDPLLQATYLGGGAADEALTIARDAAGNILVGGFTGSTPFPGTTGGMQPALVGSTDGYVSKFSSDLTTLLQTTYLGGSGDDQIRSMRLDAAGNIYVGGNTSSTNFPGTAGGLQPAKAGGMDAFLAKLSGDMATLQQATYLGGGGDESDGGIVSIVFDAGGNLLVAGTTQSGDFPGRAGGGRPNHAGARDAFVSRVAPDLKTLLQSTYYGGSGLDFASVIAIDGSGKVLITGTHWSTDLPMTAGGAQPAHGGRYDGYVARFSADLTALEQATYFGGTMDENTATMAVDSAGHVFIAGYTASPNLPAAGAAQSALGGSVDVFVARLSPDLTAVQKVTYYGGNGFDLASTMVIDAAGNVIVAGTGESTNLPGTAGAYQSVYRGSSDGLIAKFNNDLTVLTQATYFGGSGREDIPAILIDGGGNYVIAGTTASNNLTGTTGGAQPVFGGGARDAFVARFTANLLANPVVTATAGSHGSVNPASQSALPGRPATVTVTADSGYVASATGCGGTLAGTVYTTANVTADCSVTATFLLVQTISVGPLPTVPAFRAGTSFVLPAATSSSGLPVTYTSTTPAICTVAGTTVTMVGAGTCGIIATQAGNGAYAAATANLNLVLAAAEPVGIPALSPYGVVAMSLLLSGLAWRRRRADR